VDWARHPLPTCALLGGSKTTVTYRGAQSIGRSSAALIADLSRNRCNFVTNNQNCRLVGADSPLT
jgi:hypothetical protein